VDLLSAIRNDNQNEYANSLNTYKMTTFDIVIGLKENVEFGNKKDVKGEELNPLHWAVYTQNLKATKMIVETQIFNILIAGKVPTNTGLANDSEISIEVNDTSDNKMHSSGAAIKKKNSRRQKKTTISEKRFGSVPRSLILFWAVDQENHEMLNYLWSLPNINWGLKNLKFLLAMI
jgi:hypothetical protein